MGRLDDRSERVQKHGTIYLVNGLRPAGTDYENGKWHWSEKLGSFYTHSLPEAVIAGYKERDDIPEGG